MNRPKGQLADGTRAWEIQTNDQLRKAAEYAPLVVAYRSGQAVRLADVASVDDAVEDLRTAGLVDGRPAVMLVIFRQPDANIIGTVDRVHALIPRLRASIPGAIDLAVVLDRSTTIRASLREVQAMQEKLTEVVGIVRAIRPSRTSSDSRAAAAAAPPSTPPACSSR